MQMSLGWFGSTMSTSNCSTCGTCLVQGVGVRRSGVVGPKGPIIRKYHFYNLLTSLLTSNTLLVVK